MSNSRKAIIILSSLCLITLMSLFWLETAKKADTFKEVFSYQPCENAKNYYIATIDERFMLSGTDFKKEIDAAAGLWSDAFGEQLFKYNPHGDLSVNLVYNRKNTPIWTYDIATMTDEELATEEATIKEQDQKTKEELRKIEDERKTLAKIGKVTMMPEEDESRYIDELTIASEMMMSGDISTLEEAIYNPMQEKISIYTYKTPGELRHTIAHELGHALGLQHTSDPHSIMYFEMNDATELTQADKEELQKACGTQNMASHMKRSMDMMPYYFGLPETLLISY